MENRNDWVRPPPDIEGFGSGEGGGGASGAPRGATASSPGRGGAPAAGGGMNVDSPFKTKPPRGIDFNPAGFNTGLNNVTTPAVIPGTAYTIPAASVGVIRSVVLTVNNLLLTSQILWRLRFNQAPVPGWHALTVTPGAVAYFLYSWGSGETFITVPPDTTIDVEFVVQAGDAAAYVAGAAYHGWFFDKALADAAERAYQL